MNHRYEGGQVFYSAEGITLKPHLLDREVFIAWNNVDFISPTPAVNNKKGYWETFDGRDLRDNNALQQLNFLNIELVVKNKSLIARGENAWQRLLFRLFFPVLFPLYNADDKPDLLKAYFEFSVKKNSLNVPLSTLLDFIQKHARLELLCHM